tara:strand:- start:1190 stop:1372 length:183 start_codon:yes stop_codon:yes gene_type:complete
MIKLLYNLKSYHNYKSRSKKPSLETIPENKSLYTTIKVKKKEQLNTIFETEHWSLPNKKT